MDVVGEQVEVRVQVVVGLGCLEVVLRDVYLEASDLGQVVT